MFRGGNHETRFGKPGKIRLVLTAQLKLDSDGRGVVIPPRAFMLSVYVPQMRNFMVLGVGSS